MVVLFYLYIFICDLVLVVCCIFDFVLILFLVEVIGKICFVCEGINVIVVVSDVMMMNVFLLFLECELDFE